MTAPSKTSGRNGPILRSLVTSHAAQGEPNAWALGGALAFGILMIVGFLTLVLWNGIITFWPKPIAVVTTAAGEVFAGEESRREPYRVTPDMLAKLSPDVQSRVTANGFIAHRTLYRLGNFDLYGEDFRWVSDFEVKEISYPKDLLFFERLEWGPFIGRLKSAERNGEALAEPKANDPVLMSAFAAARDRFAAIRKIEKGAIGDLNHDLNELRLAVRKEAIRNGEGSASHSEALRRLAEGDARLKGVFDRLNAEAEVLKRADALDKVLLADVGDREKTQLMSSLVRFYPANDLSLGGKLNVYASRWIEFLTDEPREANTEGGVLPAIFGTFAMTVLLSLFVAPIGVITALYLREYAKQGRMVAFVRISVNNLAGVPSIVYGVFGLGFFAYLLGGSIDAVFFPERLPNPTFGTGGLLWSALTLAIMTVPVVIVATEEALSAVPRSMREGSLACGASKWQTIQRIVLPRAMPGIMTGLILAMARGAGEVAPLMLVGVVKLAPELPIDHVFPFIHLERSFMHLGFHIYDVGFQSRNSEAGKPMVFVTTLLLIVLIALMNAGAIYVRERLKRRFAGSQF